jgi:hypothetical protein
MKTAMKKMYMAPRTWEYEISERLMASISGTGLEGTSVKMTYGGVDEEGELVPESRWGRSFGGEDECDDYDE